MKVEYIELTNFRNIKSAFLEFDKEVNIIYGGPGMTLGQTLKQARLARGMTQAQVVGERITRNMLSQIENDQASPSVGTLEYLAAVLEKLEENETGTIRWDAEGSARFIPG